MLKALALLISDSALLSSFAMNFMSTVMSWWTVWWSIPASSGSRSFIVLSFSGEGCPMGTRNIGIRHWRTLCQLCKCKKQATEHTRIYFQSSLLHFCPNTHSEIAGDRHAFLRTLFLFPQVQLHRNTCCVRSAPVLSFLTFSRAPYFPSQCISAKLNNIILTHPSNPTASKFSSGMVISLSSVNINRHQSLPVENVQTSKGRKYEKFYQIMIKQRMKTSISTNLYFS